MVGHLIVGAEGYTDRVSRGLQGDVSPPAGRPPAGAANAASISEGNAQRAIATRERLDDQLLATFNAANARLNQLLARVGPQDWETLCYHASGLHPVRTFVDLRLTELVMHGWDIRSRLEPDAHLLPESLPAFLEMIAGLCQWAFWPGPRRAASVRYRFEVTGPVPSRTDIVVEGEQVRMEPVGEVSANVTFCCETEVFVLLMYGRLNLPEAIADGRLAVEGDEELVTAFAEWFRGI